MLRKLRLWLKVSCDIPVILADIAHQCELRNELRSKTFQAALHGEGGTPQMSVNWSTRD